MLLREIRCFMAVADCLNFTTAANQLYISQPGLSKIISNLENELSVRLFIRSTRSVRLTKAGEQFLGICRDFVRLCEGLSTCNPQDSLGLSGSLSIGIGELNDNRYLPQIVGEFTARHAQCNLSVRLYSPEDLLAALDTGEVDFGAMISYAIPVKGYQSLLYYPSRLMLVVPPFHRLANRERVHISELKDENFLSINRTVSRSINQIQEICAKGNFRPKIIKETNSLSTLFMLVATGMGISLNFLLHKDACNYDLRFIELDTGDVPTQEPTDGGALVWKSENQNPAVQPFIDCIQTCTSRFGKEIQ